jgi:1-aminocyclopropane-1-carboxylate deaminase/D-cysteine desulfhydrase-like pyridoxal-dependent ACC family enzyme
MWPPAAGSNRTVPELPPDIRPLSERAIKRAALQEKLATQPRVALGSFPTPLEPLPNLSRELGGASIHVKRDDLTGLAFGGNKTRSLEYVLGEVMESRPEVLVTGGNIQSNWCRQATAAAAKLGIPIVLVLRNSDMQEIQGNVLLDYLLGAEVRFVDEPDMTVVVFQCVDEVVADLQAEGRRAVKLDSWSASVALGYVHLMAELDAQCEELGHDPTRLWVAAAGATQAGALLGARMLDWPIHVTGVAPIQWTNGSMEDLTADCANQAARLLGSPIRIAPDDVESLSDYVGPGYGLPSPAGLEAMRRVARSDGLLLDPVYTGKAMAALIDHVESERLAPGETVVFVHTGGLPALFAFDAALTRFMGLSRQEPIAR